MLFSSTKLISQTKLYPLIPSSPKPTSSNGKDEEPQDSRERPYLAAVNAMSKGHMSSVMFLQHQKHFSVT